MRAGRNGNDALTSFGLTLYNYTPDADKGIVMQFGGARPAATPARRAWRVRSCGAP